MLYKLKLANNAAETTKFICCTKDEGIIDHCTVRRSFEKFHLCCNKLNDPAASGRPKTMDSETVLQTLEANPVSNTQRVLCKLNISEYSVVHLLCNLNKSI